MAYNKIIYNNNILIDLTSDTIDANKLLNGYTAHNNAGEVITGSCTYNADTSDADVNASEVLEDKIAYANGNRIVGTMPNKEGQSYYLSNLDDVTIQSGYYDGSGEVGINETEKAKIISTNIKSGVEILGVTGTYEGEGGTGQAKTVTPYTTSQTILPDSGFDYLTQVTVEAIAYVETPNAYGTTVTIGTVAPTE